MANNCWNSINITGKPEDIKSFVDFVTDKDNKVDLTKVIPVKTDKDGYYLLPDGKDIYDLWGTKWLDCDEIDYEEGGDSAHLGFDTAWSPSRPISLEISRKWNLRVEHYYEEPGVGFEGDYIVENGEELENDQRDYIPDCEYCDEKVEGTKYYEGIEKYICPKCFEEHKREILAAEI